MLLSPHAFTITGIVLILCISLKVEHSNATDEYHIDNLDDYQEDVVYRETHPIRLWHDDVVYYQIGPSFNHSAKQVIAEAMDEISSKTCIRFQKRTTEPNFVYFRMRRKDGCHTKIGCHKGKQIINLDPSRCIQHGRIMHELLHALGFYHEHQRPDRDDYVTIFWKNIRGDDFVQFGKVSMDNFLGFPYDYGSVMHYGNLSTVASIDPAKPILLPKMYTPVFGQRLRLSSYDAAKINKLYECNKPKP